MDEYSTYHSHLCEFPFLSRSDYRSSQSETEKKKTLKFIG